MKKLLYLTPFLILPILLTLSCMEGDSVLPTDNLPPDSPTNPFPADSATEINTESVTLSWTCSDPNWDDLTYRLIWSFSWNYYTRDTTEVLTSPNYTLYDLVPGITYRWSVMVDDGRGDTINGPYWHFTTDDTVVHFTDIIFETWVRYMINKPSGDILASDINTFYLIYADNLGITDLTGIEYMADLYNIEMGNNLISNLSPLSNLQYLNSIHMHYNLVSDLSPLPNLASLHWLDFSHNPISDLTPLSELHGLYWLIFNDCQISDLSPLSSLEILAEIQIDSNQISDLSPLIGLENLSEIYATNNQISDLSPLSQMPEMEYLFVNQNLITDLDPLSNVIFLRYINLADNQISDISALEGLPLLCYVNLSSNQITNIAPLVNNPGIFYADQIYLTGNPLDSISVNVYIPELEARGVDVYY